VNWLGITYMMLAFFSLATAAVNFGQGVVLRADKSLFVIAFGCLGFGVLNTGVALSSSYGGAAPEHMHLGVILAAAALVELTFVVPMVAWSLLDVEPSRAARGVVLLLCAFAIVRAAEMIWRSSATPGISWEQLHLSSVSPLALPSGILPVIVSWFWVGEGVRAWRQGRRLGRSFAIFGLMAMFGAAKGILMALGLVDPPDTFGFMALPAAAFAQVAASVRFIDAVRTANTPSGDMERYQILRKLGEGGMGDVFLARRRGPAGFLREVVLKTMRRSTGDPDARERFLAEARVAAQLRHPNIVDVYDLGAQPDGFFIVMERIEGLTLGDVIRRNAVVPADVVAEIGMQLCRALGYAHAARVIHRDIKPTNVMVTVAGVAKLIDFGIAQEQGAAWRERKSRGPANATVPARAPALAPEPGSGPITSDDGIVGTMGYLPPERLRGGDATGSADLFALGVVLYEVLTLHAPFPVAGREAVTFIDEGRFPRVLALRPDCPGPLAEAIEQCLKPAAGQRPPSAAALEVMLGTGLGDRRVDLAAWLRTLAHQMSSAQTQPAQRTSPMAKSDAPTTPARVR
jgi:serine/threonine-protein kinase